MKKNILKPEASLFQLILLSGLLSFLNPRETFGQQQPPAEGKYVVYDENGKPREKGFYHHSQKHRTWYFYGPDGSLDRKEKWSSGILQWQIFYNKKGRIIKTVNKKGEMKIRPDCGC